MSRAVGERPALIMGERRCPKCVALIRDETGVCGFCRTTLRRARSGPAASPVRRRVILAACLAWTAGAAVFLVRGAAGPPAVIDPGEECRGNLLTLHAAYLRVQASKEGLPRDLGADFWAAIVRRENLGEGLRCGAGRPLDRRLVATYRGPRVPVDKLPPDGVIACDRDEVHPEGVWVLAKDGRVTFAPREGEEHARALRETR